MNDTIAAISTPSGTGGIGVIRLSGPDAEPILLRLFRPASASALPLRSHLLTYGWVIANKEGAEEELIDECEDGPILGERVNPNWLWLMTRCFECDEERGARYEI